jgi:hypothetical protein
VTARFRGEVLAVESIDLANPKRRTAFAAALSRKRPDIDTAEVEAELLRHAGSLAGKRGGNPAGPGMLPELDVSSIVRPERLITTEVSGLTVPTMTMVGDKPAGRWTLYLQWANGKRERRSLPPFIDLADGRRLWILPTPAEPTASTPQGWSAEARQQWLQGAQAPDPADLFKRLSERFTHFIELPRDQAPGTIATLALWTLLTYVYHAWDAVPYLHIGGPLGSGKSRVFEILLRLVFRPLLSSSMTAPSLFRTLDAQGGTLLLDEAEQLKQTRNPGTAEIVSMLLAGHKRGGQARRLEPAGDSFRMVAFDVYGPKGLACIAGLPPVLASRAIGLTMFRAPPGSEKPRRRIDADPAGWEQLRDDLHSLAMEHGPTWLELPKRVAVCPTWMGGRDCDLWQPLLALTWWVESHGARGLLGLMQKHALEIIDAGKDDSTPHHDEALLRVLTAEVRAQAAPTPSDILHKAKQDDAESFKGWTPRAVSEHLKRYGLTTNKSCGRKVYGRVTLDKLRAVQDSYGIDLGLEENGIG